MKTQTLKEKCMEDVRRFFATGELPDAWLVDDTELDIREEMVSDEELDRRVEEINRELEAIESGCVDSSDPRHPNHPITCVRPCCNRREP